MYINIMKKHLVVVLMLIIVMTIFSITLIAIQNKQTKAVSVSIDSGELSNKKVGWGIKRAKDHAQPDLGSANVLLLDKYEGICMGNSEDKYIYLTFDEGYEAGYTEKILETLKSNEITATFFITGHYLNKEEALVKKMLENGNLVGNHTVNHKSMPDLTDEKIKTEVMDLHKVMYEKTGFEMKYIRPPMGEFSQRTLSELRKLGYTTVMWSVAYDDWDENKQKGDEYSKDKILSNIHPGAVILLHASSKDNANVLDYCIKEIKKMGYEFKSLDEFER